MSEPINSVVYTSMVKFHHILHQITLGVVVSTHFKEIHMKNVGAILKLATLGQMSMSKKTTTIYIFIGNWFDMEMNVGVLMRSNITRL